MVDFAAPANYRVKLKEGEKRDNTSIFFGN